MKDKVVLITGGTGGIGLATAEGLARLRARLVIVGRNRDAGALAAAQLLESGAAAAEFIEADLSSQTSVHRLANAVLAKYDRLDVLLNNAGAFFPKRQETEDQLEATLAVNHLAPFLLTHLVLPLLKQTEASRIINVNSDAHRLAKPPLDNDPQWRQRYSAVKAYANAKLLNLLCTYEWSRFLAGDIDYGKCIASRGGTHLAHAWHTEILPMVSATHSMAHDSGTRSGDFYLPRLVW